MQKDNRRGVTRYLSLEKRRDTRLGSRERDEIKKKNNLDEIGKNSEKHVNYKQHVN